MELASLTRAAAGSFRSRRTATRPFTASSVYCRAMSRIDAVALLGTPLVRPPRRSPGLEPRLLVFATFGAPAVISGITSTATTHSQDQWIKSVRDLPLALQVLHDTERSVVDVQTAAAGERGQGEMNP